MDGKQNEDRKFENALRIIALTVEVAKLIVSIIAIVENQG